MSAVHTAGDRAVQLDYVSDNLLVVAIVGGAIVPFILGHVADLRGLKFALWVPLVCYFIIAAFGVYARRSAA